jgi:hypothetical protein
MIHLGNHQQSQRKIIYEYQASLHALSRDDPPSLV